MYVQNRRIVASRRGWLKQFGITVGALSVGLTSTTERAEAIGVGGELVAMSLMNPEVRKSIGRYKKGLLGGASTLLSIGVLGLKKLDEITDTILGAELGQISEKAAKQREIVDGGHWKYSSRLLPYANNLMLPSQSIVGEFNLRFKEFLAPVPKGKGGAGFDATFSDYNQQELLYSLTVEPCSTTIISPHRDN